MDQTNPRGYLNIITGRMKTSADLIPQDIWEMDLDELEKVIAKTLKKDKRLRASFWSEYHAAVDENRRVIVDRFLSGVMNREFFYNHVLPDRYRLAYILTPLKSYTDSLRSMLQKLAEEVEQIIELPLVNSDGEMDYKAAELKFKMMQMIDKRLHGDYVQRVEQKNLHMQLPSPAKDVIDIDQKLMELEQKAKQITDARQ